MSGIGEFVFVGVERSASGGRPRGGAAPRSRALPARGVRRAAPHSYAPMAVYSHADVDTIVNFAFNRGIRVRVCGLLCV